MRIIWSRTALQEQHDIWMFLAERNDDYADRVEARIEQRVRALADLPWLGRPLGNTGRRLLSMNDVQYVVEYEVDAGNELVRILSIWSPRRNREA